MKKIALFLLTLLAAACSKPERQNLSDWMRPDGKIKVMSTTAMIEDLVKQIGGDFISSICLINGRLDPHSYELVKGDDEKFSAAHLIFYNGIDLEHGASVRYRLENSANAIPLGDQVFAKFPERFLSVDGQIDPHIWMDMSLFAEVVDPIVEALCSKDPIHASEYTRRGQECKEQLKQKDTKLCEMIRKIPEKARFLVTSHDAFNYFAKRYLSLEDQENWQTHVQAPEGIVPDGQMSVMDIQKVSDFICENGVGVIFPETNISQGPLQKIVTICRKRGVEVEIAKIPLHGDAMAENQSYAEMMEHNVETFLSHMAKKR